MFVATAVASITINLAISSLGFAALVRPLPAMNHHAWGLAGFSWGCL